MLDYFVIGWYSVLIVVNIVVGNSQLDYLVLNFVNFVMYLEWCVGVMGL